MTIEKIKKAGLVRSEIRVFEQRKKALECAYRIDIVSESNTISINKDSKLFPIIKESAMEKIDLRLQELQSEFAEI